MMLINNVKNMFDNICNHKATVTLRMFVLTEKSLQNA